MAKCRLLGGRRSRNPGKRRGFLLQTVPERQSDAPTLADSMRLDCRPGQRQHLRTKVPDPVAARLGAKPAIWAVAHRLLRVIWKVLHDKASYVERGLLDPQALERRRKRSVRHLRKLGFAVTLTPIGVFESVDTSASPRQQAGTNSPPSIVRKISFSLHGPTSARTLAPAFTSPAATIAASGRIN